MRLLNYIGSIFLSLLPPRYRQGMKLKSAAMTSGAIQTVVMIGIMIERLRAILDAGGLDVVPDKVAKEMLTVHGGKFLQANEVAGLAQFWTNPINFFLFYMVLEGAIRYAAASATGDVIGSLPLYTISLIHDLWDKQAYKKRIGPLVVDEVSRGGGKSGYDLKVYSCRPKLHWNPYMSIEYEGEFYQLYNEEHGPLPRRFIYYLRKSPVGRAVVVIDHYKVENVFQREPDKFEGHPGFFARLFPKKLPPLVADEIVRGGGSRHDYDLKIYSCRPKKDWNTYVTIEFEEQWYQLKKEERGPDARPFIYYLRLAPPNRPAVVIRKYSPDAVVTEINSQTP